MSPDQAAELQRAGWRLSRDGSTATASLTWDDPDDPDGGWVLLVLKTAGHAARFTLEPYGSGLTEQPPSALRRLQAALAEAAALLADWQGELPGDGSDAVTG
jgi:hypothetical protein